MKLCVEEEGLLPRDGNWLSVGEGLDHEGGEEGDGSVQEEDEGCCFGDHFVGFCGMTGEEKMGCGMR